MKQIGRCTKCGSLRIGRLNSLPDTLAAETELARQALGIMRDARGKPHLVGLLEAYVCTECGYLETYVQDPHTVPFEKIEGFSWTEGSTPYR